MSTVQQRRAAGPATAAADPADPAGQPQKARLRGAIHHYAVFVALGVGIMLVLDAQTRKAAWGCVVYTIRWACVWTAAGSLCGAVLQAQAE